MGPQLRRELITFVLDRRATRYALDNRLGRYLPERAVLGVEVLADAASRPPHHLAYGLDVFSLWSEFRHNGPAACRFAAGAANSRRSDRRSKCSQIASIVRDA